MYNRKKPVILPPEESTWKALVSAVGTDHLQAGTIRSSCLSTDRTDWGSFSSGRMHHNCQKQSQRIEDNVAFPAGHLLVRISPSAGASLTFDIHRLGVDYCCTGTRIASGGHASVPPSPVGEPLKEVYPIHFRKW